MDHKKIKMDEKWVEMPKGLETFGDLLGWVVRQAKESDRVILGVLHDQVSVRNEELNDWEIRPIEEFGELEFLSADSRELARHTCKDMVAFMETLGKGMDCASQQFESGERGKAKTVFGECMEGWGMVMQAYWNLVLLGDIDSSSIEIEGRTLSRIVADLRTVYTKVFGDYGNGDLKAVKESFADELALYLVPMREAFELLQGKMEEVPI